jgi:hypothetical protein
MRLLLLDPSRFLEAFEATATAMSIERTQYQQEGSDVQNCLSTDVEKPLGIAAYCRSGGWEGASYVARRLLQSQGCSRATAVLYKEGASINAASA